MCGSSLAPGFKRRRRASRVVSRISSSSGSLPMISATSRSAVLHVVGREDALGHLCDVAGLDGVDVPGARARRRNGEDAAPGADVEDDVVRPDCLRQGFQVVVCPAVVVEHAAVLDGIGPAARPSTRRAGRSQGGLLDQHGDDVHRRGEVRRFDLPAFESVDRIPELQGLCEQCEGRVPTRTDVDDGPVRRLDEDVARGVKPRADARRNLQERLR